jgi:hypothetical protein
MRLSNPVPKPKIVQAGPSHDWSCAQLLRLSRPPLLLVAGRLEPGLDLFRLLEGGFDRCGKRVEADRTAG